jgi:dihydrofolate reductase
MELSVSLDGYVAGPDISPEAPLGRGGERPHDSMFTGKSATEPNRFETEHFSTIGALILGRRLAALGIGPWGEDSTFHAPCFVVIHRPADTIVKKGGTSYILVTDGPEAALAQAKDAGGHRTCTATAAPTSPASTSTQG